MDLFKKLYSRAKGDLKTIVFPEGDSARILKAARWIVDEGIARIILLGGEEDIRIKARRESIPLEQIEIVDCGIAENLNDYFEYYLDIHKSKGMGLEEARNIFKNNLSYLAAMMVRKGAADGFVAGAECASRDVIKAVIHCFEREKDISTISSCFIITVPECLYGKDGIFIFADCAVVPDPTEKQLADIAISSASLCRKLIEFESRVAMLSFSTKGSAANPKIDKVKEAVRLVREREPQLVIDGEVQADSAIVPDVAQRKNPHSVIKGDANILIFPNLEAGNISYKLVQRLAKARTIGPLIQGTIQPSSDLSRGCSVEDIVDAVVVTAVRAQMAYKSYNTQEKKICLQR